MDTSDHLDSTQRVDLIHCEPKELAEEASWEDLLHSVEATQEWQVRQAEVLDYVYQARLLQLLDQNRSETDLEEMAKHLRRVLHPRNRRHLEKLQSNFHARWETYRDLLENRIGVLRDRNPIGLFKKVHVISILRLILELKEHTAEISQQQIAERLGLKKANLSRILSLMETSGLIERHLQGRNKYIHLGRLAEEYQDRWSESSGTKTGRERPFLKRLTRQSNV